MLQNFITALPQLEALVQLKIVPVDTLPGRPPTDQSKYAGKVQQAFQVVCDRLPLAATLAMRAVEDVHNNRSVLALVLYDNVIAGREIKGELVYRHTFFIYQGDAEAAAQFASYLNIWVNGSFQQLYKPLTVPA